MFLKNNEQTFIERKFSGGGTMINNDFKAIHVFNYLISIQLTLK